MNHHQVRQKAISLGIFILHEHFYTLVLPDPINVCSPSPCGPYSICREVNGHAVCSCQSDYIGSPPNCRPECIVSSECSQDKACVNQRCVDPCIGTCGQNAKCQVINHNPICSCSNGYTGDPFVRCTRLERKSSFFYLCMVFLWDFFLILSCKYISLFFTATTPAPRDPINPCVPSPCGPNSVCREINGQAACSCVPNYIGRPPNCRPECLTSSECAHNLACVNERCINPCPGSCGQNAECTVINHNPVCTCYTGYEGDPLVLCNPALPPRKNLYSISFCK